jgi:hypothetical protein
MICSFTIDGKPYQFQVDGKFFQGQDLVLFQKQGNVLEGCLWVDKGYEIVPIFTDEEFLLFKVNIEEILKKLLFENGIPYDSDFTLEKYHRYVKSDEAHQKVISKTRFLTFQDFKIDMEKLIVAFSKATGKKLQRENPLLKEEIVILRINRPSSLDINPFHRDGYLELWKNVLNVWIPIEGCGPDSSLPVIPGSHYWNEKEIVRTDAKGATINGLTYHVPAILSYTDGLHSIRPNPPYGSALIFTPYLVHGAAINSQKDITRVSLELRLYFDNKKD